MEANGQPITKQPITADENGIIYANLMETMLK